MLWPKGCHEYRWFIPSQWLVYPIRWVNDQDQVNTRSNVETGRPEGKERDRRSQPDLEIHNRSLKTADLL